MVGKVSLVGVGHPFSVWPECIAPNEGFSGKSPASGEFPFSLRGQSLVGPFSIVFSSGVGPLHHGIVFFSFDGTIGSGGVAPVCALNITPPLKVIVQRDGVIGRSENDSARIQVLWRGTGKVFSRGSLFSDGYVAGGQDERGELAIGHIRFVHEKAIDIDSMDGP